MKYSMINKKTVMLVLSFFAFLFLWGCAEDFQSQRKDPFFEKWSTMADTAQGHSPYAQPKKIDTAALSSKKTAATPLMGPETRKLPQSPIHLAMRQADLKAVLRAMAKSVNLNLLVKNELKGEISVDFKGVAWDKAFTGLLQTYGLSYVWEGDIIRVMTIEDVEQELKRKVQMRDIQWVDPLLDPVVINIDYADPKKLADTLQDFLTKDKDGKPRGSVKVNEHTNALIISATSEDMKKILPIIEKLDKPTAQILIKANIVETSKGVARDLGIIWGGYNKGKLGGQEDLIVTGTGVSPLGSIDSTARLGMNFPAALDTSTPLGSLGLFFGKIGGNMLEVQLQALQKDNKLNILSSPSITTLDNQKAYTENGERVPYVTTETSGGTTTQTTKFEDVVLRLEITPHVIDGKNLKMEILVKKDEVDMTRKSSMGDPYIIKKETKTELIVQDGETIVISGLTKQRKSKGESGVPWLKDVPILGWAFKSDSKGDNMEEVLIFITPHILPVGSS
ncbi:MAG TPA: type IV pilus secretin PilQ [Smithella sp.]|nr:type IV pilus secretin PilQ [Smithella sp.]HRS96659.1 type IV pilus secretin PilQ [Smithella sp.]